MSYTKGPWRAEKTGLIYQENTNRGIARLVSKGTVLDANLIAAAPEMLEALEFLLDTWAMDSHSRELITKLIKKAIGEL